MENPNNFLNWIEIKNFKSIKDLRLDCKRVNVFIGKPNVGKSNILEALGLLGANYSDENYLGGAIRYEDIKDLFRDNDAGQPIAISTDQLSASLQQISPKENTTENFYELKRENGDSNYRSFSFSDKGSVSLQSAGLFDSRQERDDFDIYRTSPVKKYDFRSLNTFTHLFNQYLLPPHGNNLYAVINRDHKLWEEFSSLFRDQNLEFVLSEREQSFVLQKKEGSRVKQYPFFSIADTFRRFMFYLTAIESNTDSVIVLEEPEVHSFPPYVQTLAFRMIDSTTNQFFVSTHSPYLLQTLIEHLGDEQLNVFITYYEDYQTKARALTSEELSEVQEFSIDVFYNLRRFIPTPND